MTFSDYIKEKKKDPTETINRLDKLIKKRRADHEKKISVYDLPLQDFEYLTTKERKEMHQAKLSLPGQGELVKQAKERIQARIKARKK